MNFPKEAIEMFFFSTLSIAFSMFMVAHTGLHLLVKLFTPRKRRVRLQVMKIPKKLEAEVGLCVNLLPAILPLPTLIQRRQRPVIIVPSDRKRCFIAYVGHESGDGRPHPIGQ